MSRMMTPPQSMLTNNINQVKTVRLSSKCGYKNTDNNGLYNTKSTRIMNNPKDVAIINIINNNIDKLDVNMRVKIIMSYILINIRKSSQHLTNLNIEEFEDVINLYIEAYFTTKDSSIIVILKSIILERFGDNDKSNIFFIEESYNNICNFLSDVKI